MRNIARTGCSTYQAGRSAAELSLKRYRYTGKERDEESGFTYHGARYYAPWLGRWVSTDPSGLTDGICLYRYSRNSPVVLHDPNGRDPKLSKDEYDRQLSNYEARLTKVRGNLRRDRTGEFSAFHVQGSGVGKAGRHGGSQGGGSAPPEAPSPPPEGKGGPPEDKGGPPGDKGGPPSDRSQSGTPTGDPNGTNVTGTGNQEAGGSKTNLVGGHGKLKIKRRQRILLTTQQIWRELLKT